MQVPSKRTLLPLLPTECDLGAFEWPLEKKAYGLLWALLPFCLFWWVIDKREPIHPTPAEEVEWNHRRANWVLGWTAVLVVLWLVAPDSQPWKLITGVLAGLRLLEIFVTGLGTILNQSQQVRARNVITIVAYAMQVTFIFAILYHSFAATAFESEFGQHPGSASDFLYISWGAMVSLGNETFKAEQDSARFLEIATTTASLFLLGVLLAFGIEAVRRPREDDGEALSGADNQEPRSRVSLQVERVGKLKRVRFRRERGK